MSQSVHDKFKLLSI